MLKINPGFSSCTICILSSTLRQTLGSHVMKPAKIYDKLKMICKHLVHGRQEDAHEFLRSDDDNDDVGNDDSNDADDVINLKVSGGVASEMLPDSQKSS